MPIRTGLSQSIIGGIIDNIPLELRNPNNINYMIARYVADHRPKRKRRMQVTTTELRELYCNQRLTLMEISLRVGLSSAAISQRLRNVGVKRSQATWIWRNCPMCGKSAKVNRARARRIESTYCSMSCYAESRANPQYFQSRQGQRTARLIVQEHYALPINAPYIVHHKDSNTTHNNQDNLMVFANQSDHLKHHHGKAEVVPLWDGSHCECERCGA